MSYKDEHPLRSITGAGYGDMPSDMYLRKIQQHPTDEDPHTVENYLRNLMVDFRPDEPFLASDEARDPSDRGGGTHSTERLNLRYSGARDPSDPYLPDGTFLDWEFTERDPRGTQNLPPMRQLAEQRLARAALIKYGNDSDYSVPEIGVNPGQAVRNVKAAMEGFRSRYKNFEESKDSWHNGGTKKVVRREGNPLNNVTVDGTIIDLADATQRNRVDAISKLSNDPTIAFRHSTPDQRFKIARYGVVRARQDMKVQDWKNNRQSAFQDHANFWIDGQQVNRMLGHLIVDLQGQRNTKQAVAEGATYGDSASNSWRKKKMHPDDIYKIMRIGGKISQANTANSDLADSKQVLRYGNKKLNNNRKVVQNAQINHEIAASMEQTARALRDKRTDDLRDKIEQAAHIEGLHTETNNRRVVDISKWDVRKSAGKASGTQEETESFGVRSYAGIKPSKKNRSGEMADFENYGGDSDLSHVRDGKRRTRKHKTTQDTEYGQDQNAAEFGTFDPAKKEEKRNAQYNGNNARYDADLDDDHAEQYKEVGDVDLLNF